jgi:hypothetical protein
MFYETAWILLNIATVRKFDIISDKCTAGRLCTSGNYTKEQTTKLYL